jgi:hypothetical protein
MRCPQSRPATISCRQTMTASKTFGGVAGIGGAGIGAAGIGGAGERRRFESRLSLTYTTNGRPQNMRMGLSPQSLQRRTNDGSRRPERLSESLVAVLHNGIKAGRAARGRLPAPLHCGSTVAGLPAVLVFRLIRLHPALTMARAFWARRWKARMGRGEALRVAAGA